MKISSPSPFTIPQQLLDMVPLHIIMLDNESKIRYANNSSLQSEDQLSFTDFLGKSFGEAIHCVHFLDDDMGCGDNDYCKMCGTYNIIHRTFKTGKPQKAETRMSRKIDGKKIAREYEITSYPLTDEGQQYVILIYRDISDAKRIRNLERIFFHDVMNKLGSLSGFFNLMKNAESSGEMNEYLQLAEIISTDLGDEIKAQRDIMAAESGELAVENDWYFIDSAIESIVQQTTMLDLYNHQNLKIKTSLEISVNKIYTDITLFKRVLLNMLKNAVEAASKNETIYLIAEESSDQKELIFIVKNKAYIPENTQLQIFNRSFSTKGKDRGLGTYSMKLIGERYLNGKVGFSSNKEEGTSFYLRIKKNPDKKSSGPGSE